MCFSLSHLPPVSHSHHSWSFSIFVLLLPVITIIKPERICMVSFTKSFLSVKGDEIFGGAEKGREGEKKLPSGATTKWKQHSQPKACSLKQQRPEQRRCCVFSTTSVLYGGPDLSRRWPQPVREGVVCLEMTHYTSCVRPQSCCQSGEATVQGQIHFHSSRTRKFSLCQTPAVALLGLRNCPNTV